MVLLRLMWSGCWVLVAHCSGLPPCAPLAPHLPLIALRLIAVQPRANHVWMAGVGSAADEAEVLRCCREGAIPPPEHLLKVGCKPGVLGRAEWRH